MTRAQKSLESKNVLYRPNLEAMLVVDDYVLHRFERHYQYSVAYIAILGGRGETLDCA